MLLLFACSPQQPVPPDNTLSTEQMSKILAEMHIADAIAASGLQLNQDSINQKAINYREFIYTKYRTNHSQFMSSFAFYKQNPALMDSIYTEVVTRLSNKETEYRGK